MTGIVCEFNPFHNGHEYLLKKAKELNNGPIICLMSGNAVQRGEPAIIPSVYRAKAAMECGADAVLELPFPYSCSSAFYFASAAVGILGRIGVDRIVFGSECGDIDTIAEYASKAGLPEDGSGAVGAASAYYSAVGRIGSNDMLGAEYFRAAERKGLKIEFVPIKRVGAAHGSEDESDFPSASLIRKKYRTDGRPFGVPEASASFISEAIEDGYGQYDEAKYNDILLSFLRTRSPESLSEFAECGGGVAERLCACAFDYDGTKPFSEMTATKKYTDARFRRALLFAYFGVTRDDLENEPEYVRTLGVNSEGRAAMKKANSAGKIKVVSRTSDIPLGLAAKRQKSLQLAFEGLYTMLFDRSRDVPVFFKKPPYVIN